MNSMEYIGDYNDLILLILVYYLSNRYNTKNEDLKFDFNDLNIKKIDIEGLNQKIADNYNFIISRENSAETCTNLGVLFKKFKFSLFEKFCFLLSLGYLCDEKTRMVISSLDSTGDFGVSLDLAYRIFEMISCDFELNNNVKNDDSQPDDFEFFDDLMIYILGLNSAANCNRSWPQKVLSISEQVQSFVFGVEYINKYFGNIVNIIDNNKFIEDVKLLEEIDIYLSRLSLGGFDDKLNILLISGKMGSGKKTQVMAISRRYGVDIIFVDLDFIVCMNKKEIVSILNELIFECILFKRLICLCNFKFDKAEIVRFILCYLDKYFSFVILLTKDELNDFDFDDDKFLINSVNIPDLNEQQRVFFWNKFLKNQDMDAIAGCSCDVLSEDIEKIARGFLFTVGKIKTISQKYFLNRTNDRIENTKLLKKLALSESNYNFGNFASRVDYHFDWDDLVLDDDCKSKLLNICDRVKLKDKVYNELNFKSKFPYGDGVSALFYGPPGTGKTMAAKVVANQIGCELYKIDLSQVIDKYVGETEKNLKDIFDRASKTNVVLFFDEADAIFSKRTNVVNANDKYSNIETSYLLQRIEEYRGICILATNFLSSFDEAFKRRIKFVVNFNLPNLNNRLLLWKKAFPAEVNISSDVDFYRLSEKYELTGSSIKSIALSAVFYAVKHQDIVSAKYIKMAMKEEFEKNGKIFSETELDMY